MKIGDYVRTDGYITKIKGVSHWKSKDTWYISYDRPDGCESASIVNDEFKISPNIIDLIEVGDYVNGKKVIDVYTDYIFDYTEEFKVIRFSETDILHDRKHIETVVTKEQFEAMKYEIK